MSASKPSAPGFTLVELIIVMALLAIVAGLAAPSLSRSLRQRNLNDEAARLLALTEYARDEAISQGVPMTLWIDPSSQHFGVGPKTGFDGDNSRSRDYAVNADIHFEVDQAALTHGVVEAVEMAPDGSLSPSSLDSMRMVDRFNSAVTLAKADDGFSYSIVKEQK